MKTLSSLTAHELLALNHRISVDLDRLGESPPSEQPRTPYKPVGLLASALSDLVEPPPLQSDRASAWREAVAALEANIETNDAAAAAVSREKSYANGLRGALVRQAKLRGRKFADPRASLWLLAATSIGLGLQRHYMEKGTTPSPPLARDWQEALEAVDTLASLERKGVWLSRAIAGNHDWAIPFDWLDRLKAGLQSAAASASKPHKDNFIVGREACKTFAHHIYFRFDHEVPPVLIEHFADLIGYPRAPLKRHLPNWTRQFGTDSLV